MAIGVDHNLIVQVPVGKLDDVYWKLHYEYYDWGYFISSIMPINSEMEGLIQPIFKQLHG